MAKQEEQLTFTFVNPNTPKTFEQQLQKILTDKLVAQYRLFFDKKESATK